MIRILGTFFLFLIISVGVINAADVKTSLSISEARIVIPPKGTNVTAGYGIFKNNSDQTVTLKIKSAKPFKAAELHETIEKDGNVGMNKVEQIAIPPRSSFELKPGSHHIMFFDPSQSLKPSEMLTVEFVENGKAVTFKFKIVSRKAEPTHDHSHH